MKETYPYTIIGLHYKRHVRNRQAIVMVKTIDGERRDATPKLLLSLPKIETLFSPQALDYLMQVDKQVDEWLARFARHVTPLKPSKKQRPILTVLNNGQVYTASTL